MNFLEKLTVTMSYLKEHKLKYHIGILGMTLGFSTATLLEGYLLKQLLESQGQVGGDYIRRLIILIVVYMVMIIAVMPVFQFMFNGSAKYSFGNINKALHGKFVKLPMPYFESQHSGRLMSVFFNDASAMAVIVMRHYKRSIVAFFTVLIYLIPMFYYDWRLTSVLLFFNMLSLAINKIIGGKLNILSKKYHEEQETLTTIFSEIISGMSVLRMYNLADAYKKQFNKTNGDVAHWSRKQTRINALLMMYNFFISMMNMALFIFVGYIMVAHQLTTYGNIMALMALQTGLDLNFREFGQYFPSFYKDMASTERIQEVLELEEEKTSYSLESSHTEAYISFENVTFGYTDENILTDFNLSVQKGDTVALIGESGSGKSSIGKLLLTFYKPKEGVIRIDNRCLSEMTLEEVRDLIAYVPQNAYVFNDTILENIRYGNVNASDEAVIEAAKAAYAHDFIEGFKDGYQTIVGEKGIRLSGGQKQRLAIARAILKDAPILLLDEATSNLDTESERFIKKAISEIGKQKTTIMIAHRLSTIEDANVIVNC